MKELGRRGFLKALGIAPVAAPAAAREIMEKHGFGKLANYGTLQGAMRSNTLDQCNHIADNYYDDVRKQLAGGCLLDHEIIEVEDSLHYAPKEFDADIAAMKSTSAVFKTAKQAERNRAASFQRRINNKVADFLRQMEWRKQS